MIGVLRHGATDFRLMAGTTLEGAREHGAMYVASSSGVNEQFTLPARMIQRLGYLPRPEVAWIMFEMMEHERETALG